MCPWCVEGYAHWAKCLWQHPTRTSARSTLHNVIFVGVGHPRKGSLVGKAIDCAPNFIFHVFATVVVGLSCQKAELVLVVLVINRCFMAPATAWPPVHYT